MKSRISSAALLAILLISSAAWAQDSLTVDDIVSFKEAGASDEEIMKEVRDKKAVFDLSPQDVKRLQAAGISENLVSFLKSTRRQLGLEDIVRMTKEGMSDAEIISRIQKTGSEFALSAEDTTELNRQGVSPAVIRALVESARYTVDRILKMLARGTPAEEIQKEIVARSAEFEVTLSDVARLRKAGAPADFIRFLNRRWKFKGMTEYNPATRYFTLVYPQAWAVVEDLSSGSVCPTFTPYKEAKKSDDAPVCFEVGCWPIEEYSVWKYLSKMDAFKRRIKIAEGKNIETELKDLGKYGQLSVAGLEAVKTECSVLILGRQCKETIINFQTRDFDYILIYRAPVEEYEGMEPGFQRVIESFEPGEIALKNRAKPGQEQSMQQIMDDNLQSVVYIECQWKRMKAQGSGFIIREDGYVITNAHVVLNMQTEEEDDKLPQTITVHWDKRVGREPARAQLIGQRYSWLPHVDVALIKLDGEGYRPMSIVEERDMHEGDTIFTMGFPQSFTVGHETITTTKGIIARFMYLENNRLNEIVIDAAITHGNSGGPCISTKTGGVIGLNTFGMEAYSKDFALNYNGLVPIQRAIEEFPAVFLYSSAEAKKFSERDHLSLGMVLMTQKKYLAARLEFERAIEKAPELADAYLMAGRSYEFQGSNPVHQAVALSYYEKAFQKDPKNIEVLQALGNIHQRMKKYGDAIRYLDKAIDAKPGDPWSYYLRGKVLMDAENYTDAFRDASKAVELARDLFPGPYCLLGDVHYFNKKYEEALAAFNQALDVDPKYWYALYSRAECFERMNKPDMAEIEYSRMVEKSPDEPEIARIAGDFYFNHEKWTDAFGYFKKAYDLYNKRLETPSVTMLNRMGFIAKDIVKDNDLAFSYLSQVLKHEMQSFQESSTYDKAVFATTMYYLGSIFDSLNRKGLAWAHYEIAHMNNPNDKVVADRYEKAERSALTFADVVFLGKLRYHPQVPFFMAQVVPLPGTVPEFMSGYFAGNDIDQKKVQNDLQFVHEQVFKRCIERIQQGKSGGAPRKDPAPEKPKTPPPTYTPPPEKPKEKNFTIDAFKVQWGVNKYLGAFILNNETDKTVCDIVLTFKFLDKGGRVLLEKTHKIEGSVLPGEKYPIEAFEIAPAAEVKALRDFNNIKLFYTHAKK